jgi:hypothetical protein
MSVCSFLKVVDVRFNTRAYMVLVIGFFIVLMCRGLGVVCVARLGFVECLVKVVQTYSNFKVC